MDLQALCRRALDQFKGRINTGRQRYVMPAKSESALNQAGMHFHHFPELIFQLSGHSCLYCPGLMLEIRPRVLCLTPPGVPHYERWHAHQSRCQNINVAIHADGLRLHSASAHKDGHLMVTKTIHPECPDRLELLALTEMAAKYFSEPAALRRPLLASLMTMIIVLLQKALARTTEKTIEPGLVNRARQLVDGNLHNPDLNVSALAAWLGCSADYLSHLFKKTAGLPLAAHINQVRLKYGASLLLHSGSNVAEVAYACGYADPGYFARQFNRLYKMSPRAYRNEYGQSVKAPGAFI